MNPIRPGRRCGPPAALHFPMKKYERLAQDIEELVTAGTLVPGDRLPSVRESVRRRGVSPSTVFQAYYLLESRGVIEARPRSGYFVKSPRSRGDREPHSPLPREESTAVAVSDLVLEVLGSIRDRDVVPMGSAFPSPLLFPLDRLARAGAAAMRKLEPGELLEDISPGNEDLRRQLALRYVANGTAVNTEEIVVTSGAMEALNLCLQVATRARRRGGDRIPGVLRLPAGAGAAAAERGGDRHRSARGRAARFAAAGARAAPGQGLLVHAEFPEPDRVADAGGQEEGPGRAAGSARGAADRGRCLRGAVLRKPPAAAGQGLRQQGPGDALQHRSPSAWRRATGSAGRRRAGSPGRWSGSS